MFVCMPCLFVHMGSLNSSGDETSAVSNERTFEEKLLCSRMIDLAIAQLVLEAVDVFAQDVLKRMFRQLVSCAALFMHIRIP